ncbi:MAG: chromate transporter [Anaerolineae bacterium]|nr:chromate transporter [Anaerolineae bacterium]
MIELWELFRLMFKVGLYAYGGGPAMLPVMQAEVVEGQGWVSDADFRTAMAMSYSLPGPVAPQLALWVGWRVAGWPGAVLASFAVVLPGLLLMSVFMTFFWSSAQTAWLKGAAKGAGIAVIGLLAYVTYDQAFKLFARGTGGWVAGVTQHLDWVIIAVLSFALVLWRPTLMMPLTIAAAALYGALFIR